jgi:hypothetical protein
MSGPTDPHAGKRYRFKFWNREWRLVCKSSTVWDSGETLLKFSAQDGLAFVDFEVGLVRCTPDE